VLKWYETAIRPGLKELRTKIIEEILSEHLLGDFRQFWIELVVAIWRHIVVRIWCEKNLLVELNRFKDGVFHGGIHELTVSLARLAFLNEDVDVEDLGGILELKIQVP